jgi:hypothetical protein
MADALDFPGVLDLLTEAEGKEVWVHVSDREQAHPVPTAVFHGIAGRLEMQVGRAHEGDEEHEVALLPLDADYHPVTSGGTVGVYLDRRKFVGATRSPLGGVHVHLDYAAIDIQGEF